LVTGSSPVGATKQNKELDEKSSDSFFVLYESSQTKGRIGVFSLRALDAEFIGNATASWPVLVNNLVTEGHVHPEAAADTARLWAFGMLIGNIDIHHENLSFISSHKLNKNGGFGRRYLY